MSEDGAPAHEVSGGLGALQTDVLAGSTHIPSDVRMVGRAIREGWPIPPEKRPAIVGRLIEIVEKRNVTVMTNDGPQVLDGPADVSAVSASRVIVAMDSTNQTDYWNEDKNSRLDAGKLTENHGFMPAIIEQPVRITG